MPFIIVVCFLLLPSLSFAQKRAMQHSDFDRWNSIVGTQMSNNGTWIAYHLKPGKGDQKLCVHQASNKLKMVFDRAEKSRFTADSRQLIFRQKLALDSLNQLRRQKLKKAKWPKDTLVIVDLKKQETIQIPHVLSYKVPEKWSGWLCYVAASVPLKKDTSSSLKLAVSSKKTNEDNGHHLILHKLSNQQEDTLPYVLDYRLSESGASMIYHTSGKDSLQKEGLYYYDFKSKKSTLMHASVADYAQMSIDKNGEKVVFLVDVSSDTDALELHDLYYWEMGLDTAECKLRSSDLMVGQQQLLSANAVLRFSDDANSFYFGIADIPLLPDSNLLPEEQVQVEIWHYQNGRLHTQQNAELKRDKKRSYLAVYQTKTNQWKALASKAVNQITITEKADATWALGRSSEPYEQLISWEGYPRRQDIYSINTQTGQRQLAASNIKGTVGLSAKGHYLYWYNALDSTWYAYSNAEKTSLALSQFIPTSMADERNDVPNVPYAYGLAGWTENDAFVLLYDRYDIWKVNVKQPKEVVRLTQGREQLTRYRYLDLDPENAVLEANLLLRTFNETNKNEGYVMLSKQKKLIDLLSGGFKLSKPIKARDTDALVFSKQNFKQFPDLIKTDLNFTDQLSISEANPQQKKLRWGTVELHQWTSLEGMPLQGLLYKPEGFDSTQKYPMMVYFYERYSDRLHQHRGVVRSRSSINPTFYTSRGYVVFMPDIVYRTGYPGESCYNAVIPGVTSLIDKGFVRKDKIGVQGHSWGGYQIAYLVTKTNIFKCAEAGAPVSNMISAYGGIRWQTGLSRMFQYEHTQSRLGGTLWEKPLRYIENSPIFYIDKIQTPLLLLHNDNDGHVPWYQGIEMYVALRRLGKPSWMLNYNGEPHWPTSYQNIRDLTIRMQQYFDYYLKDEPMPEWMYRGIPAIEKGINDGQRLMKMD